MRRVIAYGLTAAVVTAILLAVGLYRPIGCIYQQLPVEMEKWILAGIGTAIVVLIRYIYKHSTAVSRVILSASTGSAFLIILFPFFIYASLRESPEAFRTPFCIQSTPPPIPSVTPTPTTTSTIALTPTLTSTNTATATITPTPTSTPTPLPPCAYIWSPDDREAIDRLLQAEAAAASSNDLPALEKIFLPDALIFDGTYRSDYFIGPQSYFQHLYKSDASFSVSYRSSDPAGLGILKNTGWYTSNVTAKINGAETNKMSGWSLAKNSLGCWQISSAVLNQDKTSFSYPCICSGRTDKDTLTCLINQETETVLKKDMALVSMIFAPNAIIRDGLGEIATYDNPLVFYKKERFDRYTFKSAFNTSPQPKAAIQSDWAYFVSGSNGIFIKDGITSSYSNPSPACRWIFGKSPAGCWVITEFDYNTYNKPFATPPVTKIP